MIKEANYFGKENNLMEGTKAIEEIWLGCIKEKARNVTLGHGSFITMGFGRDVLLEETVGGKT